MKNKMNLYQQQLWDDLMHLVDTNEAFFFADKEMEGKWFRLFNYRMASYTDFCLPNALECRGHTFEITEEGKTAEPLRIASMPFQKFFNLNENPMTMNIDLATVVEIGNKCDGSLISSYLLEEGNQESLRLKTKGSLDSDQAIAAFSWLNLPMNEKYKKEIAQLDSAGFTVNLEWCSPDNRIVLNYEEPVLTVLSVRSRVVGSYLFYEQIENIGIYPEIISRWTERKEVNQPEITIPLIYEETGVEGVVCRTDENLFFKVKCDAYCALHHMKDNINHPRRLYECVLLEATDDMKSLFHDDPSAIGIIEEMEDKVRVLYNNLSDTVERYYERNKHLERRDYAILGQQELTKLQFKLAMNKYLEHEFSYNEYMIKHWKNFGIKGDDE